MAALTGRRGVPGRLLEAGFDFDYPTFDAALQDLLGADRAFASLVPSTRA